MITVLNFIAGHWRSLLVAGFLIGAGLWVRNYGNERCAECTAAVIAKYEAQLSAERARIQTLEQREADRSRLVDIKWQEERNELQERISHLQSRREPVRMCKPAASRDASTSAPTSSEQPDGAAGERRHDLQAGRDLGDDLVRYAGECERYRRQLTELQLWVRETMDTPTDRAETRSTP